jgi:hypothetical protein
MLAVTCIAQVQRIQKLIADAGSSDKFEVVYMKDPEEERKEMLAELMKGFQDRQFLATKESSPNPEPFYKKFETQGGNQCKRYPKRK